MLFQLKPITGSAFKVSPSHQVSQSKPIPLCLPVGCVHIKTFTQIDKTFRYLARFHAGVDQLLQQHRVEFVNLFNVGKEYLQFVQAQTGALLPVVQVAKQRERETEKGERRPQLACKNCKFPSLFTYPLIT